MDEDERNCFATVDDAEPKLRDAPKLYCFYDPVDVEFVFRSGAVRMVPLSKLSELQKQYGYVGADCIFATCNGDPVFLKAGKVYTCPHGTHRIVYEELAPSFDAFIKEIIEEE